jgi:hypothetical protein
MDQRVIELATHLQAALLRIDPQGGRETLEWAHGFLIALIERIEKSVPGLTLKRVRASDSNLDEAERILDELALKIGLADGPDSLEQIEKELGDPGLDDAPGVPAKRKPGPKGLSGGAALPLPE